MTVEAPYITEIQQRLEFIDSIIENIANHPDTFVFHKVSEKDRVGYLLKFPIPNVALGWVEIEAWPDDLVMERALWDNGALQRTVVKVNSNDALYKEDGKEVKGAKALHKAETNRSKFLPPTYEKPLTMAEIFSLSENPGSEY